MSFKTVPELTSTAWRRGRRVGLREGFALGVVAGALLTPLLVALASRLY